MSNVIKSSDVRYNSQNHVNIEIVQPRAVQPVKSVQPVEVDENSIEVLKANILEKAQKQAQAFIEQAEQEVQQMFEEAKKEALNIKVNVEHEARERGYQQGYQEGIEEAEGFKKEAKQVLQRALEEKEQLLASIEPNMIKLIIQICKQLLGHAIQTNDQTILYLIKKGLNEVTRTGENISIRVSDKDFSRVMEQKENIFEIVDGGTKVEIVKDFALEQGDCIIETPFGNIDCSLDQQFEGIKKELLFILDAEIGENG